VKAVPISAFYRNLLLQSGPVPVPVGDQAIATSGSTRDGTQSATALLQKQTAVLRAGLSITPTSG
jgi:hypothetical protein